MVSTDLSFGRHEYLMSGGKVTLTSSSISATHSILFNGTPYSCWRIPRIQSTALVIKVLTPTLRPIRSLGLLMPLVVLMNMKP
jgi:hypothetical protein